MKRNPDDYSVADVLFSCPGIENRERLTQLIAHECFPAADYVDEGQPHWHQGAVIEYWNRRADTEFAAGLDPVLINFIKTEGGADDGSGA